MIKKLIFAAAFSSACFFYAQVGINTTNPKSTLDISKSTTSNMNGLLIPRLISTEVLAMPVTTDQNSMMIYLTEAVPAANRTGAFRNMDAEAHYYYDASNTVWLKILDTNTKPSGLERISSPSTDFGWRFIGATPSSYGTLGKYAADLSWNPSNLAETFPYLGTYGIALASTGLTASDMGALGQGSFVTGAYNSAKGGFSTLLGASNKSGTDAHFSVGIGGSNSVTGLGSVSIGTRSTSSNTSAVSIGTLNTASGESSIVLGVGSTATSTNSVAIGQGATSSGAGSVAVGAGSKSSGLNSFAMGADTNASGDYAFAMGNDSDATGLSALSIGYQTNAAGRYATAMGLGTIARSQGVAAIGEFNSDDPSPEPASSVLRYKKLFTVGNGTSATNRSDAFAVLRNGKVGINITAFDMVSQASDAVLQVNGNTKTQGFVANFRFGNTIQADDYTVVLSADVTLPDSNATNKGRIINICSDGTVRKLNGNIQDSSGSKTFVELGTSPGERCLTIQSTADNGRWWIIGRN